jgi:DNA-binding transcriptional MerR regulator
MKIREVARTVGIRPSAIRFYETQGLLPRVGRTASNYRSYTTDAVERLQFIQKAKRLGFSLEDVRGILQLHDRHEATCSHVRLLMDRKLAQVDALLKELREFRIELRRLRDEAGTMEDCRPSGGHICGIVERGEVNMSNETLGWLEAAQRAR